MSIFFRIRPFNGSYANLLNRRSFRLDSYSSICSLGWLLIECTGYIVSESARLRKSVRIVSSKQVFSPEDEEEGENPFTT